jgi:hypothetical protein
MILHQMLLVQAVSLQVRFLQLRLHLRRLAVQRQYPKFLSVVLPFIRATVNRPPASTTVSASSNTPTTSSAGSHHQGEASQNIAILAVTITIMTMWNIIL